MTMSDRKILVVQVAALGWDLLEKHGLDLPGLTFQPTETIFPALTCPVQASMRTGAPPSEHGMLANGRFDRQLRKALFWEQSSAQVQGPRIWDDFRDHGGLTGMFFWQQSLGESVDWVLSPAPIHRHHGGMIQDCACHPPEVYPRLLAEMKRPFNLMRYWGPLASPASSQWIAEATAATLACPVAPQLLFTYLPALDYDLQRYGPSDSRCLKAWHRTAAQLQRLVAAASRHGYEVLVYGDYAITDCPGGAVYPNRQLREAGLLATRRVKQMDYLDLHHSAAFAMVDHEVAHVYVGAPDQLAAARHALAVTPGVADLFDVAEQQARGLAHPEGPELLIVAEEGYWFSYRWWTDRHAAPDYAGHVDIHNKPGFDPCELFFGWPPGSVSQHDARVGGTHGRAGPGRRVAWASTAVKTEPGGLLDLAQALKVWLGRE